MTITLERTNIDLRGEQARREVSNKQAAQTFQQFTDSIQKDRNESKQVINIHRRS